MYKRQILFLDADLTGLTGDHIDALLRPVLENEMCIRDRIHPQSIVHSAVEFIDGSVIAQLGPPDMRLPIQYALSYPERKANPWPRFNFLGHDLSFTAPDTKRFPCLELAFRAMQAGGTMPACLNAANEVAVEHFLKGVLAFPDIPRLIERVMATHTVIRRPEQADLEKADSWARRRAEALLD